MQPEIQGSAPDELVFNINETAPTTELAEVKNLPKLSLVSELHPILKEVMPQYDFASEPYSERKAFCEAMVQMMRGSFAMGLSSNQVGERKRMFVMDRIDMKTSERFELLVCFNPEVVEVFEENGVEAHREGCISFPGLSLQVKRPQGILARYEDEGGNMFETELFGLDARCFQHELDHLNGITFTDKVERNILNWEREKQRKLVKKAKKRLARR